MGSSDDTSSPKHRSCNKRVAIAIFGGAFVFALVIGLAIGLPIGLRSCDSDNRSDAPTADKSQYKSGHGRYRFATVVADASLCSKIGTEVMALHRGNVVDATVATVICNGVMNAHSAGIGGGSFIIYYNRKTKKALAMDAMGTAPGSASQNMYVNTNHSSTTGGMAVAVPGELKGLWELHRRYGTVAWSTLLQPTIDLCNNGAPLTKAQRLAANWDTVKPVIQNNPMFSYLFAADGSVVPTGTKVRLPRLAKTLKTIADQGADAFYKGSLTDDIVADVRDAGGILTRSDLKNYEVNITDALTFTLSDTGLIGYSMPPPGGGAVLSYILNILSGYKFNPESLSKANAVLTYHRMIEAMKFAYAKRTELGDPHFVNLDQLLVSMTSSTAGDEIRAKIDDDKTHDTSYYGPTFDDAVKPGTAHFSLMDGEGNVVSITSTVNTYFGSKVKGNRTGIVFNNEMDDFSTPNPTNFFGVPASPANFIQPGKRPLSSMAPSIFVDSRTGDAQLVVGAAGGTKIMNTVAQVAMDVLWFNMTVTAAVDAPRIHHQLLPNELTVESAFPKDIVEGLKAKGHAIKPMTKSVVTAIHRTGDNLLEAASDYRKGGEPDGF